jgi:hypothetical protein
MPIAIVGAPGTGVIELHNALPTALLAAGLPRTCALSAAPALDPHPPFELVLLCGLPHTPADPQAQLIDTRLRQRLDAHEQAYAVVYGDAAAQRIHSAVQAIAHHQQAGFNPPTGQTTWQWQCEKCSDAACEHRLFSSLLKTESVRP